MKEKNHNESPPSITLKGRFATAVVYAQTVDEKPSLRSLRSVINPFPKERISA
jgi:hypothetical protein